MTRGLWKMEANTGVFKAAHSKGIFATVCDTLITGYIALLRCTLDPSSLEYFVRSH